MAKTKSKIRRYAALIYTLLTCLLIVSGIVLFVMVMIQNGRIGKLEKEKEAINAEIIEKNEAISNVEDQINDFLNIEEDIEEVKKSYFEKAIAIENKARNGEEGYKVCFLTFDDGPYVLTSEYLDVLKKYDILGTFFLLKKTHSRYDETYLRYKTECHTIGNHSTSHEYKHIYSSVDNLMAELNENRDFIKEKLNYTTEVMRFPGGSYELTMFKMNRDAVMSAFKEERYGYADWNCLTGDGEGGLSDPDYFYHRVVDNTYDQPVIVVLMHDYSSDTLAALPNIIEELTRQGYTFLPLCYDSPTVKKQ